jgi:prepilin-type processing-associated H-X9-DG protein
LHELPRPDSEYSTQIYPSTFSKASSKHSVGVNCLFADGSVKFIKDSISQATWWSLGTRANGEVVDASSY